MSRSGIGDQGDVGFDDLAIAGDLAPHVGAGLDHHRLGAVGRLEDGERHSDQVVVVGAAAVSLPPRRQHRRHHLPGGGLAVLAGHGDHRPGHRAPPFAS
ncbi:MAG TPA: hypothetical protein PLL69_12795, partial [Gemmatimonadales bacterium]|nr:hypothetical protein [Gemmatimonadales bacterium]